MLQCREPRWGWWLQTSIWLGTTSLPERRPVVSWAPPTKIQCNIRPRMLWWNKHKAPYIRKHKQRHTHTAHKQIHAPPTNRQTDTHTHTHTLTHTHTHTALRATLTKMEGACEKSAPGQHHVTRRITRHVERHIAYHVVHHIARHIATT